VSPLRGAPTAEQFDRLTATLDRARAESETDTHQLSAIIDEAARMLSEMAVNGQAPGTPLQTRTIIAAAERTRRSHALLVQAIKTEMDKISRQIGALSGNAEAATRYGENDREVRPPTGERRARPTFDRVG
jgi:hypothetical protein